MKRKKTQARKKPEKLLGGEINDLIDTATKLSRKAGAPFQVRLDAIAEARKCIETREGLCSLWTTRLEDIKFSDRIYG